MADIRDVQTARRHIRGHKEAQCAIAETVQRAGALRLLQIAMDRGRVIAIFHQRFRHDIHIRLAVAEDDRVAALLALGINQLAQKLPLLAGFLILAAGLEHDHALRDRGRGAGLPRHFDPFRGRQERIGDPLDFGRHGGAEKQCLTGKGCQAEDPLDIGNEAHIQHPVRLVHHHDLHAGQQQLAPLEMIQQAAGGGDQHVNTTVDQLILFLEGHATDQQRLGQLVIFRIGVEVFRHLRRQFAGRTKHKAARHAGPRATLGQQRDHRQREAGGLACPGLGDPQNVAAFQRGRNGPGLNGRRGFIPRILNRLEDLGVEFEIREFYHVYPLSTDTSRPVASDGGRAPMAPWLSTYAIPAQAIA